MGQLIKYIILVFVVFTVNHVTADNIQFTASTKGNVATGERFEVVYSVNADAGKFKAPSFKDFNVLSGPSQSSSTSVQIINGSVSQSISYSYSYILEAVKEGTFTIPPATVEVNGKSYQSNSLTVKVAKGNPVSQQQSNTNKQSSPSDIKGGNLYLKTIVNKTKIYKGEQLYVIQKIYTRFNLIGIGDKKFECAGFWSEDIKMSEIIPRNENVNGILYQVAELKKSILIPQRSGKITIGPAEIECKVQTSFFDVFGTVYKVKSQPVTIEVLPLPSQNVPGDFNGAVGSFSLKSDINKTNIKTNEAVNLKITVSGNGNLKLIDNFKIYFPPDLETYDPKISDNTSVGESGVSGSKTFEYVIIPRNPGQFKIPSVVLTYFDISKKAYTTLTTPEYILNVGKGDGKESAVTYSGVNQEDIKYIGSDIRFIKTGSVMFYKQGYSFFGSGLFWLLLLCPVVLFVLFVIFWRDQLKKRRNIALMRNKKATRVAQKRLKKANAYLKENNKSLFYEEISRALWGYLSDKLTIPVSELSIDSANAAMNSKNISGDIITEFTNTLNNCEFARFAPGDESLAMDKIYNEALETIKKIEKEIK